MALKKELLYDYMFGQNDTDVVPSINYIEQIFSNIDDDSLEIEDQENELIDVFEEMQDYTWSIGLELLDGCTLANFIYFVDRIITD